MKEISKRLRVLRKNHHMTQEDLSEHLGYTPAYYGQLERGDRKVSMEALMRISRLYQLSLDYILTGTEPDIPEALTQLREPAGYPNSMPYSERLANLFKDATEEECRLCYRVVCELLAACRTTKSTD